MANTSNAAANAQRDYAKLKKALERLFAVSATGRKAFTHKRAHGVLKRYKTYKCAHKSTGWPSNVNANFKKLKTAIRTHPRRTRKASPVSAATTAAIKKSLRKASVHSAIAQRNASAAVKAVNQAAHHANNALKKHRRA